MFLSDEHKSRDRRDPWGHRKYMDIPLADSLRAEWISDATRIQLLHLTSPGQVLHWILLLLGVSWHSLHS